MTRSRIRHLLLVALCVAFSVALYTHGGQDDTYITYWAGHALSVTGGIVNYNGDAVEQSSSLGMVVILGALRFVTRLEVPVLGYLVGLAALGATVLLVRRISARFVGARASWFAASAGTVPCFAYWSTSGMETSVVVASALWSVVVLTLVIARGCRSWRHRVMTLAALLVFSSSRPETPVVALGLIAVGFLWAALQGRAVLRRAVGGLAIAASGVVVLVGFRVAYFGSWVPNPALVKRHGFELAGGIMYLLSTANANNAVLLPALIGGIVVAWVIVARAFMERAAIWSPSTRTRLRQWQTRLSFADRFTLVQSTLLVLLVSLALAYVCFIVASGGDWMKGGRFYALVAPVLVAVLAGLVGRSNRRALGVGVVLMGTNLLANFQFLRSGHPEGRLLSTAGAAVARVQTKVGLGFSGIELTNKAHARDAVMATRLSRMVERAHQHLKRPVTIMSGQAGMVAFHTFQNNFGNARFLDLWNITNQDLLRCVGPEPFKFTILGTGHDLGKVLDAMGAHDGACGGLPDIYFNERLRAPHKKVLQSHGYTVVYHQVGRVRNSRNEKWFPSSNVADGHIVMRTELAKALGLEQAKAWRWDLNP